jgi:hypothetical protein
MIKPFSLLEPVQVPSHLKGKILVRVAALERRASVAKRFSFGGIAIASLAAIAASVSYVSADLQTSGFLDYLSVLGSGGTGFFAYAKELALSIVETLPVMGLAAVAGALGLFGWSAARFADARKHASIA